MMAGKAERRKEPEQVMASEARDRLTEMMNRARYSGDRFVITQNGQPAVALISAEELDRLDKKAIA